MNVVRKIDDIGRIAIPKDLRRSLRWMGGDEIEIISNEDESILLRKHEPDSVKRLVDISEEWTDDEEIQQSFVKLIELINKKTK